MSEQKHINLAEKLEPTLRKYHNEYPYLSDRKLANLVLKEENLSFTNGYFRNIISAYRSKLVSDTIQPIEDVFCDGIDLELPESLYEDIQPYILPASIKKLLVIGDLHLPYQDNSAIRAALNYAKAQGIDAILLNGDILDNYAISDHERDLDKRSLFVEIKIVREFLSQVRKFMPAVKIYYKMGNHENRYYRYLCKKCPELGQIPDYQVDSVLHLKEYDVNYIEHLRVVEAGKLNIVHGDEYKGGGQVNIARNILMKSFDNVLTNHYHRNNRDTIKTIKQQIIGSWSIGCLCGMKVRYHSLNQWSQGFAIVEIEKDGKFTVYQKEIVGGVVR